MISAVLRDIIIILVGLTNIALFVLLGILVWQLWQLIKMIRTELKPIIDDTQETVGTVRGTADFVSQSVVDPMVRTSSRVAGFRRSIRVMQDEILLSMGRPLPPVIPPASPTPPVTPTPPSPVDPTVNDPL